MKLGIIGAMEEEITLLRELMDIKTKKQIAGRAFYEGTINGKEIVLVLARIGKVAAAVTTTTLLLNFDVDAIVFTGVAGAVDHRLNIGDIVISNHLVQHDMDASPIFPQYEIPLLGITKFKSCDNLSCAVMEASNHYIENDLHNEMETSFLSAFGIVHPKITQGTIVSGDQFVKEIETIERIRKDIDNAQCVEMEGASVAQVCYEFNKPFIIVRIISDKADHSSPVDFHKFLEIASFYSRGIIRNLLD